MRDDQTMAFQLEKHAGEVLGPYSKGLVSIGLAESLFEKGGNIYKVLELANRGLMETMNGGKFELQFVGAALVARVHLVTGHPGDSVKTLEEIETRAKQRGARRVVRNVRAMQSRIKLWQGRVEDAVRWMENEPQNEIHFNVLERYCYNTFVRVYMAQQRYYKTAQILMLSLIHISEPTTLSGCSAGRARRCCPCCRSLAARRVWTRPTGRKCWARPAPWPRLIRST